MDDYGTLRWADDIGVPQVAIGRPSLMRLYFDDQIFLSQSVGGISRYFTELIRAFSSDSDLGVELASAQVCTTNTHMVDAGFAQTLPAGLGKHRQIAQAVNRVNRMRRRRQFSRTVHHTFYDGSYLNRTRDSRTRIVTIYDMIPEIYPELFPYGNPHRDKRQFVDAADLILCISEATRRDLVNTYGPLTAEVVVTPLGVDERFRPDIAALRFLPERYILYVGRRDAYKDFHVLAAAFAGSDIPRDVALVAIGGGRFDTSEDKNLSRLGIATRTLRLDLDDTQLAGAYANALCFVFPSRHEGFGLPTLEAMACGCPTILSASSAHPEAGGEAALYFPPGDNEALAMALNQVVLDPAQRHERRAAGLVHAAAFTWHRTAQLTADAYRRI